jgi:MFS family permease
MLATVNASNFTVAIVPLSKEFEESSTRTGYLVCFNTLWLGLGNLIWVSVMRVVGKRPVYLLALLIFVGANVWSREAQSYGSLLASRIVSAFASSAADATVPSLVADLFFVHERGHCMMLFHFALSCGFFGGPLISAYITQGAGWRWSCGFLAIAGGVTFLVGCFTIRETSYPRHKADVNLPLSAYPAKKKFINWLSITNGYDREGSFFGTLWRIICLFAYPPIVWTGLTVGSFVGWYVCLRCLHKAYCSRLARNIVVQLTSSRTFTAKPYGWTIGDLGLLSIAGWIGAVLAFFLGGRLIDIIATRLTRKNNGRREPEFRLPAVFIPAVIGPMGVLIFGLCIVHKTSWVGAAFGYGMQGFGLTAVANIVITFAVDGYQPVSVTSLIDKSSMLIVCFLASRRGPRCCFRRPKFYWHYLVSLYSQLARSQWRTECKSPTF